MAIYIRRRAFIGALGSAAVVWALAARAQQAGKVYRIGFLANDPTIPTTAARQAFAEGLRDNGLVEGKNIIIERRFMEGRITDAVEAVAEMVRLGVDLIVTSGSQNHIAAKQATAAIPIVMVNANDPVAEGLVASLARPGGNVTGLSQVVSNEFAAKRLQLFRDAVPHISRIAVLMNPDATNDQSQLKFLEVAAGALGLTLQVARARNSVEVADVLAGVMQGSPDALFATSNGLNLTNRKVIVAFAAEHRLPSMHAWAEAVRDGGLVAYGTSRTDLFRRSATYVAKILRGARPADLPLEQPVKYELAVNLRTAKTLGLTIPRDFLLLADEVIE